MLLGYVALQPQSGYGLKKLFSESPASVYQPSPGALYPALGRLRRFGLLTVQDGVSRGRRAQRCYHLTEAGRAAHLDWLREPVDPATVGLDLALHVMRFAMMEGQLPRHDALIFLKSLAEALDGFVSGIEQYLAAGSVSGRLHAELAVQHGLAVHRASLQWARSALAALSAEEPCPRPPGPPPP